MLVGKRGKGSRWRRRGVSAVEMALILPVFLTIVLGCVDFGRFLYYYIGVVNAARAGAAYASMNNYTPSNKATWTSKVTSSAQTEMNGMTGYVSSNLAVTVVSSQDTNGLYKTSVTASYPFQTITKWPLIPNRVTMTQTVQIRSIR